MKFYWGSGSPFAWRAMLALIVKGVEFEDELLQFSKKEHKTPEYLAINPRGKVPALVDGDTVVTESLAILAYLDRKVPSPPLWGETAADAGRIARLVAEHENYLGKAALGALGPVFRGKAGEQAEAVRASNKELRGELDRFEAALGEGPWFGGANVSAADVVLYPTLMLIERVGAHPDSTEHALDFPALAESHPALNAWKERFTALPGVERAHPPHWKS
ncbi:MAG: glutathione S-transferase family protein [Myxococcota bacterium]